MTILSSKVCFKNSVWKMILWMKVIWEKVYKHPVFLRDSKITSDRWFVNVGKGVRGGSHWTSFYIKANKWFCFERFGGQRDSFSLNQKQKNIKIIKIKI